MITTTIETSIGEFFVTPEYMLENLSGKGGVCVYNNSLMISFLFNSQAECVFGKENADKGTVQEISEKLKVVFADDLAFNLGYRNEALMREHLTAFKDLHRLETKLAQTRIALSDVKKRASDLGLNEYIELQERQIIDAR